MSQKSRDDAVRSIRLLQLLVGEEVGGAEHFFLKLATAFEERGITQKLVIKSDQRRADQLKAVGCDVVEMKFGSGLTDLIDRWRLQRLVSEFQPTVALAWMNRAARRLPSGPFTRVARIGGYYDPRFYKKCDWIVANTPDLVRHFTARGWRDDRIKLISNFGDLSDAPAVDRSELNTPDDVQVLLGLGRLHPTKGFDLLLAAAARLPNIHVWIAGTGESEGELRRQTENLRISDKVHFLGWRSDQAALLKACDVCVVPSRHEPLSNVCIEAWKLGVPLVACAAEGPSWLIDNELNGLLVPLDDVDALTGAINRVLTDGALRRRLVEQGRVTSSEGFSRDAIVDMYIEFLREINLT